MVNVGEVQVSVCAGFAGSPSAFNTFTTKTYFPFGAGCGLPSDPGKVPSKVNVCCDGSLPYGPVRSQPG